MYLVWAFAFQVSGPCPIFLHNSLASIFTCKPTVQLIWISYRQPIFKLNQNLLLLKILYFNGWHINNLVPVTGDSSIFNSSHQQLPKEPISFESPQDSSTFLYAHCHWLWWRSQPVLPDYFNCLLMFQLPSFPSLFSLKSFSSNCKQNGIPKNPNLTSPLLKLLYGFYRAIKKILTA